MAATAAAAAASASRRRSRPPGGDEGQRRGPTGGGGPWGGGCGGRAPAGRLPPRPECEVGWGREGGARDVTPSRAPAGAQAGAEPRGRRAGPDPATSCGLRTPRSPSWRPGSETSTPGNMPTPQTCQRGRPRPGPGHSSLHPQAQHQAEERIILEAPLWNEVQCHSGTRTETKAVPFCHQETPNATQQMLHPSIRLSHVHTLLQLISSEPPDFCLFVK